MISQTIYQPTESDIMATIQCPACGYETSDQNATCAHCGTSLWRRRYRRTADSDAVSHAGNPSFGSGYNSYEASGDYSVNQAGSSASGWYSSPETAAGNPATWQHRTPAQQPDPVAGWQGYPYPQQSTPLNTPAAGAFIPVMPDENLPQKAVKTHGRTKWFIIAGIVLFILLTVGIIIMILARNNNNNRATVNTDSSAYVTDSYLPPAGQSANQVAALPASQSANQVAAPPAVSDEASSAAAETQSSIPFSQVVPTYGLAHGMSISEIDLMMANAGFLSISRNNWDTVSELAFKGGEVFGIYSGYFYMGVSKDQKCVYIYYMFSSADFGSKAKHNQLITMQQGHDVLYQELKDRLGEPRKVTDGVVWETKNAIYILNSPPVIYLTAVSGINSYEEWIRNYR